MSILSITFHCTKNNLEEWENYIDETLVVMTENLMDVNKYILSEVHSDYIEDGKNYNLLLVFDNDELRNDFIESELKNIAERVETKFGQEVIIFNTFLNPKKSRF
ncbi:MULTISPECIES: DUF4286 family protein [Chryseobacterium]|jgi:hypothetical protein|uniref:DUF4286 family protein n=1 Tax=Chryseobacterium rhizosphaerae TaxID=395937 RepID=A0AAE3Y6Z1_9FLAO|nr:MULTISPECIES: DUF4286 family protein [Chryseobacterium]MBL3549036.1 DUF4286 family protein [Chryseobacterium sp. KMC2]MDR6524798.1 hypothetical protein [Chryseobacterium rhizosphaerae]REC74884.1 DUF4286 family protein [Chryseobacterium rhizosphaerae]SMC33006.1 protein of unknown function [Chryseobacterium sp. YR221]GEN67814.1 hypothetical protein CRH01_23820 [Chryseobacterium rhizosphaerae]